MSPAHREPPRREDDRSVWTTTGIYIALIVLTILMALGYQSLSGRLGTEPQEVRAARGP
jgi:hypothetical protein